MPSHGNAQNRVRFDRDAARIPAHLKDGRVLNRHRAILLERRDLLGYPKLRLAAFIDGNLLVAG